MGHQLSSLTLIKTIFIQDNSFPKNRIPPVSHRTYKLPQAMDFSGHLPIVKIYIPRVPTEKQPPSPGVFLFTYLEWYLMLYTHSY